MCLIIAEFCWEPVPCGACAHHDQERIHTLTHTRHYHLRIEGKQTKFRRQIMLKMYKNIANWRGYCQSILPIDEDIANWRVYCQLTRILPIDEDMAIGQLIRILPIDEDIANWWGYGQLIRILPIDEDIAIWGEYGQLIKKNAKFIDKK